MDYEMVWEDTKRWLDSGIEHMIERLKYAQGDERERIKHKLEGMRTVQYHMSCSEKIYGGKI